MGCGHPVQHVAGDLSTHLATCRIDQLVADPDQVIADVDRRAGIVLPMQGLAAITEQVVVLDVVMHQRRLVKRLDRHRHTADRIGHPKAIAIALGRLQGLATGHRIVSRQRDERTESLAPTCQPVVGNLLGLGQRRQCLIRRLTANRRQQTLKILLEQAIRLTDQRQVTAGERLRQWLVLLENVPDPRLVQRRVLAVTGVQRDGVGGHTGDQHLVDRLLEHVETGDSENPVNVATDDDLQHHRRPLGHQDLVPQLLGSHLVVGNRTGSAFLAIEAKFVVLGRTALGVFQAVRQQQHPSLKGHCQELPLPEKIAYQHGSKTEILLGQFEFLKQFPAPGLQLSTVKGLGPVQRLGKLLSRSFDPFTFRERFRHQLQVAGALPPLPLTRLLLRRLVHWTTVGKHRSRLARLGWGNRHSELLYSPPVTCPRARCPPVISRQPLRPGKPAAVQQP